VTAALAFRGVTCVRGGRTVFSGLDAEVAPGGAMLVSGANGAGKSSLLRLAAGLLAPAAGSVEAVPAALADARLALDEERPLEAALAWWARADGGAADLPAWNLATLAQVPVRLLSTGQRQRAALARVAASGRALWLLDEPANGLDDASVRLLEARIAAHRAGGGAVVVATHIPVALPDATAVTL
jgi:heme exporter protein A